MYIAHCWNWLITSVSFSSATWQNINPEYNIKYQSHCLGINSATDCTEGELGSYGAKCFRSPVQASDLMKRFSRRESPAKFPWSWGKLSVKKMHAGFHLICILIQSSNIIRPSGKVFWILKEHCIYSPPRTAISHHGELYTGNQLKKKKNTSKRIKQCSQLYTGLEGQERSVNSQLWQLQNNYSSNKHLILQLLFPVGVVFSLGADREEGE